MKIYHHNRSSRVPHSAIVLWRSICVLVYYPHSWMFIALITRPSNYTPILILGDENEQGTSNIIISKTKNTLDIRVLHLPKLTLCFFPKLNYDCPKKMIAQQQVINVVNPKNHKTYHKTWIYIANQILHLQPRRSNSFLPAALLSPARGRPRLVTRASLNPVDKTQSFPPPGPDNAVERRFPTGCVHIMVFPNATMIHMHIYIHTYICHIRVMNMSFVCIYIYVSESFT